MIEFSLAQSMLWTLGDSGYPQDSPDDYEQMKQSPWRKAGQGVSYRISFTDNQAQDLWWYLYYAAGAAASAAQDDGGESGGWQRQIMRRLQQAGLVPTWDDGSERRELMV
jgi:hypothetical protein